MKEFLNEFKVNRMNRVNGLIMELLSEIFHKEVQDPDIGMISITKVVTSKDLSVAKVYFSRLGTDEEVDKTILALKRARGFINRELGMRLNLKRTPTLSFHFDKNIEHGVKISSILHALEKEESFEDIIERIKNLIYAKERFAIFTHIRPDGDAVGSLIVMAEILRKLNKHYDIVVKNKIPYTYEFLLLESGHELVFSPADEYDVVFVLDVATPHRIGFDINLKDIGEVVVNIDHHYSNQYFGDINFVDKDAASTAQLIYKIMKKMKIYTDIAGVAVYTGLLTDTGRFCYENTTPPTLLLAAELIEAGVDPNEVANKVYNSERLQRLKLIGRVLESLTLFCDGKAGYIEVTRKMLEETGAEIADTNDLINFVRAVKGVELAVIFTELLPSRTKVSFRSKHDINVNKLAAHFSGGGHKRAAGCEIPVNITEAKKLVLKYITEHIDDEDFRSN